MIKAENFSYGFSDKELYHKISFTLDDGQHCVLIGSNGTGKTTLAAKADAFFDIVPYLVDPESPYGASLYGGHPNAEGSKIWADALLPVVKEFLEI